MSDHVDGPPRVPGATREELGADETHIFDHVMTTRKLGFMPSMFAMMGQSPRALEATASVGEHVRFHSVLDEDLREMVICTVSQELRNEFEWCHHIHKVPERLRDKVGLPEIEDEPAPVGPALRFSRLAANNEAVDDALIETLRAALGDKGLVDLTVMVGYYQLLATFCNVLRVPIEDVVPRAPYNT